MKKVRSPLLLVAILVHGAFFTGWWAWLAIAEKNAPSVWLETRPVDPRDLISGHYVALTYPLGNPPEGALPNKTPGTLDPTTVWMELAASSDTINTAVGVITPHRAVRYQYEEPTSAGLWVKGSTLHTRWRWTWGQRLKFGIERFYVGEDSELRNARSGDVIARALVRSDGTLRLKELAKIKK
jgi:uncharacterized membrane-anchored protein